MSIFTSDIEDGGERDQKLGLQGRVCAQTNNIYIYYVWGFCTIREEYLPGLHEGMCVWEWSGEVSGEV